MTTWVDTHAHLTVARYDEDRDAVLARARAAGVAAVITIGATQGLTHNTAALALAEREPDVYATCGLHPQDAELWDDNTAVAIAEWLRHPRCVGVGETGLDYARDYARFAALQRQVFAAHCQLAVASAKPVVVHTRAAFADTLAILREHGIGRDVPGVIHFFAVGLAEAEAYLAQGMYLSIPGVVTLPNAPELVAAVPHLPLDRLLLETDSPYAAPVPKRGRRNEPAYVVHTGAKVAELLGMDVTDVAAATTNNACRLFGLSLAAA